MKTENEFSFDFSSLQRARQGTRIPRVAKDSTEAGALSTKGERTRSRLKAAVAKLLNGKSYSKLTIADVCTAASITVGGFYFHFRSHDEVVAELVGEFTEALDRQLCPEVSPKDPAIQSLCQGAAELFAAQPGVARAFQQLTRADPSHARRWRRVYDKAASRLGTALLNSAPIVDETEALFVAHAVITAILTELTRVYVYRDKSDRPGRPEDKASLIAQLCQRIVDVSALPDAETRERAPARAAAVAEPETEGGSRGARTRERIRRAFVELLDSRAHSEIGVTDICARAGVTVGGFYFHYKKKEDLLVERIHEHSEFYWAKMHDTLSAGSGYGIVLAASRVCVLSYSASPGLVRCFNDLALTDRTYADLWAQNAAQWSARLHDRLEIARGSTAGVRNAYNLLGIVDALLYRLYIERDEGLVRCARELGDFPEALARIWYRALRLPTAR